MFYTCIATKEAFLLSIISFVQLKCAESFKHYAGSKVYERYSETEYFISCG